MCNICALYIYNRAPSITSFVLARDIFIAVSYFLKFQEKQNFPRKTVRAMMQKRAQSRKKAAMFFASTIANMRLHVIEKEKVKVNRDWCCC